MPRSALLLEHRAALLFEFGGEATAGVPGTHAVHGIDSEGGNGTCPTECPELSVLVRV